MTKRLACLWCGAAHKRGIQSCPKCRKAVVRRVADRFVLQCCLTKRPDRLAFLARDEHDRRDAFVRVMLPSALPDVAEGMYREANLLLHLAGHRAFPEFITGGELRQIGTTYSAVEYIHGAILDHAVRGMPIEDKVALFLKALEAVDVLHCCGAVHGALNPECFCSDKTGRVTLVDFTQVIQTGAVFYSHGVSGYAPPEQYGVGEKAAPSADVFSLGVCLYFLLTKHLPYGKGSTGRHRTLRPPVAPSMYNQAVTPTLDAAVVKSLAQNPGDRFPSAMEFAQALNDGFGNATVVDGLPYVFPSKARVFGGHIWKMAKITVKAPWVFARTCAHGLDVFSTAVGRLTGANPRTVKVTTLAATCAVVIAPFVFNRAAAMRPNPSGNEQQQPVVQTAEGDVSPRELQAERTLTLGEPQRVFWAQFHAWPPASVSVDGKYVVEAPSPEWFPLSPGEHKVLVVAHDGKRFEIPLDGTAGTSQVVKVQFDEAWWKVNEVVK